MSYASKSGFCELDIDSELLVECASFTAGAALALGLDEGVGDGGGFPFSGGLTIAGTGVDSPFSEGSTVSGGKRGTLGSLSGEAGALTISFPFTRRSRLPEVAT